MISPLALEPGVSVHDMTYRLQEWQLRMGNMLQYQMQHAPESFEFQKTQANIDAIHRAIDLKPTTEPITVSLLI